MGGVVRVAMMMVAVGMMVAVVVLLVTVLVAVCSPDGMHNPCTHLCQGSGQGPPLWL